MNDAIQKARDALETLCNAVMADIKEAKTRLDADVEKDAPVHPVSAFLTGTAIHIGKARSALAALDAETEVGEMCATEGCGKPAIIRLGIGSGSSYYYCSECLQRNLPIPSISESRS